MKKFKPKIASVIFSAIMILSFTLGIIADENVANASVTVTVENPFWTGNPSNRYRTAVVTTNSQGIYTATIQTSVSGASEIAYLDGALSFIHYYDFGKVYAECNGVESPQKNLYIFAYSALNPQY